jgi:myo-inositol catabolism protein IolC
LAGVPAFDPEQVDLAALAERVAARLGVEPVEGYVMGRTLLRDAVADELSCSLLAAEQLVDTMVEREFFRFERRPDSPGAWVAQVPPR